MNIANDVCDLIGKMPLLELKKPFGGLPVRVLAKIDCCNPISIKDRAVLHMIQSAISQG